MFVYNAGYRYALANHEVPTQHGQLITFFHKEFDKEGRCIFYKDGTTEAEILNVLIDRLTLLEANSPKNPVSLNPTIEALKKVITQINVFHGDAPLTDDAIAFLGKQGEETYKIVDEDETKQEPTPPPAVSEVSPEAVEATPEATVSEPAEQPEVTEEAPKKRGKK